MLFHLEPLGLHLNDELCFCLQYWLEKDLAFHVLQSLIPLMAIKLAGCGGNRDRICRHDFIRNAYSQQLSLLL